MKKGRQNKIQKNRMFRMMPAFLLVFILLFVSIFEVCQQEERGFVKLSSGEEKLTDTQNQQSQIMIAQDQNLLKSTGKGAFESISYKRENTEKTEIVLLCFLFLCLSRFLFSASFLNLFLIQNKCSYFIYRILEYIHRMDGKKKVKLS